MTKSKHEFTDSQGATKTTDGWFADPRCKVRHRNTLERRLLTGMPVEEAMTKPTQQRNYTLGVMGHRTWVEPAGQKQVSIPAFSLRVDRAEFLSETEIILKTANDAVAVMSHEKSLPGLYQVTVNWKGKPSMWLAVVPEEPEAKQVDGEMIEYITKLYCASKVTTQ
jgi:hypothetical protein